MNGLRNKKILTISTIFLITIAVVENILVSVFGGDIYLNSDTALYWLIAKQAVAEHRLIPFNFNYSSDLGFQARTLFMGPFLLIGVTPQLAFILSNMIQMFLFAISVFLLINKILNHKLISICVSSILSFPLSSSIIGQHNYSQFYLIQLIGLFLSLYAIFKIPELKKKSSLIVFSILFSILSFFQGMNGIRYLSFITLPLFGVGLYIFFEKVYPEKERKRKKDYLKQLFIIELNVASSILGVILYKTYLVKFYSTYDHLLTTKTVENNDIFLDKLVKGCGAIFQLFGFQLSGQDLLSMSGFIIISAAMFTILMLTVFFFLLKYKKDEYELFIISLFSCFSFAINILLNSASKVTNITERYSYLYAFPILALLFVWLVKYQKDLLSNFGRFICVSIVLVYFSFSQINFVCQIYTSYLQRKEPQSCQNMKQDTIHWLEEEGYDFGYATYWNANSMAALSDLKLEIAALSPITEDIQPFFGGSVRAYYKNDYHTGKTFVLFSVEEAGKLQNVLPADGILAYENSFYKIFVYEHNPFRFEDNLIDYFPLLNEEF